MDTTMFIRVIFKCGRNCGNIFLLKVRVLKILTCDLCDIFAKRVAVSYGRGLGPHVKSFVSSQKSDFFQNPEFMFSENLKIQIFLSKFRFLSENSEMYFLLCMFSQNHRIPIK